MILNEDAVFSKSCKNPVYIVLMNGKSPLSSIILKATGDYFSHACIAFNDDLDPLYSFGAKSKTMQKGGMGFCISKPTDLSVFNKQAYYAVYVTYVTDEAYAKMKERLSYFTTNANKMIYDYVGLLNVWMHQSSDNRTRAYFCSRFVMDIIGAGIKLDKLPSLYRPQDIASMNNISLVNRGFDFHNYDKKITQKNEKLLKQGKLNPDDIIFESNVLNESDIYYNKDKFDSGETNLCFVTGLSGSGKSTMANGMKAEHYELDDVGFNWNFSDDNLKDYGDLIYTFFKGIGKKYRVGYAEVDDSYVSIYSDFVNYSIQYAKAHKNIKFVIEGVQLFQWINPKDLVDYAVYIKGTSRLISTYRAAKRNAGFENNTKDKINAVKKQVMNDLKYGKDFESRLKTWRKFFTNMQKKNIHEDVSSVIQKDFKSKHDMNLSQFEKMRLSDAAIQVYKQKLPLLSHVRINNNTKGYIWIDKKTDMPAAIVNVEEKDDGFTWIQAFEIFVPYKGHGLSKDILNVAIRELKATNLSVNKDNQVAIKIYKSYGFKTYKTTESMYFMSIDKNAFDDDDDEDIYDESTIMESVSPKIYFLSNTNMDGKVLFPRIPSNFMTKNGYEESKTPRVCFSTSIDGSLMGLSQNLKDKELYVHIPESEVNIYKPSVKQVPDCKITGEVWVKDKVNIKCIGKIKVIKDKGLPGHRYMYGDGKSAELYDWDWKWEEKYSVNESVIIESHNPHYTYSKLSSQKEISDFKNSMKIVFNSNDKPTDKLIKSMKKIEDNGTVIGYIGFSSYKIDGKKYLGIGNFMVLPQYQSKGYGANIITDIININKNKYDEIYCYVEESNTRAISFYKRVGKVGHLTDYGYYVTLYSSKSHVNESTIEDFEIEAETGFYDKHNRWNPIVIINSEQYRHRVECLIMRQNKLFVAKSNTGALLIPGGGVDKSLSDEEQVYNECKEEARILVENIKPTGYAYLRRTGVSESAKRLPKEQQWVGSYTEIYIADYAKDFTGFIDYCDRDSEMIRGDFRPISEIIDKLVPEWKLALIDANYISVATEALKSYKDPKLALKRRMGIKRNNAVKLGDFSNVAKSAPTPQAQTISVPSPAVSSSAPSPTKPAQTTEETKEIPETVKANANRLLCKEIASYPKFSGCYYNMDYPLYNGNGHAIVGWKMTGVHYNDFDSFNKYRDRIYEYCSKIFEDTNPGYGLKMDKKTNCIYITEI